jgi:hypothetical protein
MCSGKKENATRKIDPTILFPEPELHTEQRVNHGPSIAHHNAQAKKLNQSHFYDQVGTETIESDRSLLRIHLFCCTMDL